MNNCFTYFRKNKKKASVMFIIIILSVFCISFVYSIIDSVYDTAKNANVAPFEKFSILVAENDAVLSDDVKSIVDSNDAFQTMQTTTSIKTIFGTTSSYVIFPMNYDDIVLIVKRLDISVSEGRLPDKDTDEIIVHNNILKNKKLKIGDTMGDYTIVGSFDGDIEISLGTAEDLEMVGYISTTTSYVICPESNQKLSEINTTLCKTDDEKIGVYTYDKQLKSIDDEFSSIKMILLIILVLVSVCIVIAVVALVYIMYSGRYEEFAILNAIGYNKKIIGKKIFKEMLFAASLSWLCGIFLSWLSSYLVNIFIYSDMGQAMKIFNLDALIISLIIPVMVIIFSVCPTTRKLKKTDLISIIERR